MLGLSAPPTATLQVIQAETPREGSTDRIMAVLDRISSQPKTDEPNDPEAPKPH
jgi:hypothetical protein